MNSMGSLRKIIEFVRRLRFLRDSSKVLNIMTRKGKVPFIGLKKTRGEASLGTWKDRVEFEADQSPSNSKQSS